MCSEADGDRLVNVLIATHETRAPRLRFDKEWFCEMCHNTGFRPPETLVDRPPCECQTILEWARERNQIKLIAADPHWENDQEVQPQFERRIRRAEHAMEQLYICTQNFKSNEKRRWCSCVKCGGCPDCYFGHDPCSRHVEEHRKFFAQMANTLLASFEAMRAPVDGKEEKALTL
jgi:hypothetical protein